MKRVASGSLAVFLFCLGLTSARADEIPRILRDVSAIQSLELYSLSPQPETLDSATSKLTKLYPKLPKLREWPILGKEKIDDPAEIKDIMSALHAAIEVKEKILIRCFEPRHGLRLHFKDSSSCDVVICFSCRRLQLYQKREDYQAVFIGSDMRDRFDEFLVKHHLPLSTK